MNYVCHNYISKTKPSGVGWTHAEKKALERMLLQQAAAIEQLTKKNSDLVKLVQQLTVTQTNMKQEISTFKATLSSGTGLSGAVNNKQYYFDAVMPPGDKCGQQKPMIGWKVNYDQYRNNSNGNNVDNKYFNGRNGKFTAPSAGVYHCCASARCKQGGVCDWTITKNGGSNVRASFGTRVTNRNEWYKTHFWDVYVNLLELYCNVLKIVRHNIFCLTGSPKGFVGQRDFLKGKLTR